MKIGNKHFNLRELENLFAENFSSPVFPILADFYLNTSQIDKACKVVKIGLLNVPDNYLGQYVLAKIHIINDDFIQAEKLLINVVKYQSFHQEAIITLIKLFPLLNRSKNKIFKYLTIATQRFPENLEIKKMKVKYKILESKSKSFNKIILNKKNNSLIKFNNKLATKSMYGVLINQKKYNEALAVLDVMSKNKKNQTFVRKEKKKISKIK